MTKIIGPDQDYDEFKELDKLYDRALMDAIRVNDEYSQAAVKLSAAVYAHLISGARTQTEIPPQVLEQINTLNSLVSSYQAGLMQALNFWADARRNYCIKLAGIAGELENNIEPD